MESMIANNIIAGTTGTAIDLSQRGYGRITGNKIGGDEIALSISSESSTIIGNYFNGGKTRIELLGGLSSTTISGNVFTYMGFCNDTEKNPYENCTDTTGIHLKEKWWPYSDPPGNVGPYNISITGNVFGIGVRARHYTGIKVDPASNWNIITDNIFDADVNYPPTPILHRGTDTTIKDNKGFLTENSGEETIALCPEGTPVTDPSCSCTTSPCTTVAVPHGLDITPSIRDINVVPTNDLGNASKFWVSFDPATDPDTFYINVNDDPGSDPDNPTAEAHFSWQIGGYYLNLAPKTPLPHDR